MPGLLDLLNLDPNQAGLSTLPAQSATSGMLNFTPPTTGDDNSVLSQDSGGQSSPLSDPQQLTQAVSTAAQDPESSKGLLGAFADAARGVADKLTNLSPAASQGLLATGLGILANNNGTMNNGQLVGYGGMSGLNAYTSAKQQEAQNAYMAQQAAVAQQRAALDAQNLRLAGLAAAKPFEVNGQTYALNPGQTGYDAVAGGQAAAGSYEVTNADGSKTRVTTNKQGQPISQVQIAPSAANTPIMQSPDQIATANKAATEAISSGNKQLGQIDSLLAAADNPDIKSGIKSQATRVFNNITGQTDPNQQFRQQFDQFKTSFINSSLPPGSASDADINNAKATVPDTNASPEAIKAWVSRVRALQVQSNNYVQAQNDFLNASRGGQKTIQDTQAPDGSTIPAGTDFNTFLQKKGLNPPAASAPQGQGQGTAQGQSAPPAVNAQAIAGLTPQQQALVQQYAASGNPQAIAKLRAKGYIR